MGTKITPTTITGQYGSVDALNANFVALANEFDNTLSRDGESPNTWLANQDANSKKLINLAPGTLGADAVNLTQLQQAQGLAATLPTQGGHANKQLHTDGSVVRWDKASLTLGVQGTLPIANGGTSATTAADARTALGAADATDVISKTIVNAKGDLIAALDNDSVTRLPVGANNTVLTADSGEATGMIWKAAPVAPAFGIVFNGTLAFSVAANALTVAIKTQLGSDPTAADSVRVGIRSATADSAGFNVRSINAALSLVVSSGSTLGHGNAVAGSIYYYLIDNAGTLELAVSNKFFGYHGIVSTTAEGGAGGADSPSVMYSAAARSNVPFICIARTKDTQTTAGTWAAVPSDAELAPFPRKASTVQVFTNTGANTYTKPWDLLWAKVRVQAAGGGGGGADVVAGQHAVGGAAGGGQYAEKHMLAETIGPTETATVGAGGTQGNTSGSSGGTGGTSSFGAHVTCNGGTGGGGVTTEIAGAAGNGGANASHGGDWTHYGSDALHGAVTAGVGINSGGLSGASHFGGSERGPTTDASGSDGRLYGGGATGGGDSPGAAGAGNGRDGGTGAQGIIVVEEVYI